MAADYTRTIVFKVEDQAIKRATGQIVASLKRIEKSLEKIEKKAFTQLVTDSGKVADNIDRATRALNKYNEELRKAQTQGKLPPPGGALAVREKGGALARTGGSSRRGRFPWGAAIRGGGNLLGVGGTAVAASTIAINAANKQWNNMIGTVNKATSLIPGVGDKFHIVEAKVNGLSISLHALGQVMQAHPLLSAATAALIFGVGVNVKDVTTAVWGLKNGFVGATKGVYGLGKATRKVLTDLNPLDAVLSRVSGKFSTRVSGSYGGPVDKGFVSGKGYGLGLGQFLKPAKDATVDVFDIGKSSPYSKYDFKYGGLPYVDREAAERQRFTDVARARGLDPRQKMGMGARIRSNVEASRISRAGSGFGEWTAHINGSKRANKLLTEKQKILKAISRQNAKLKAQGKEEIQIADVLNKKARERLGITEKEGEWSYGDRRKNLMSRDARRERRDRARQRMNRRKQNRFAERTGMDPKQAENLMLGFGFPMLFGGGVGAVGGGVGGAALGNLMGMPGFGLQILGSSLGTQLEQLHSRVVAIGNATQTLSLDKLEESGIRVNAQLEIQINRLKKVGKFKEAEKLLERKVSQTTGSVGTTNQDIANNVAMLKNVWDGLLAAAGTTIGIIAAPFVTALAAILKLVQLLLVGVNVILSAVGTLLKKVVELIAFLPGGKKLLEGMDKAMQNMNGALDDMTVNFQTYLDDMKDQVKVIEQRMLLGDKEAAIQQKIAEAVSKYGEDKKKQIEAAVRAVAKATEEEAALKRLNAMYKQIGTTIKDGLVDGIMAAVEGTKTLGEVAGNVFRAISRQMLNFGVSLALSKLPIPGAQKFFGFANGGRPPRGRPSIVGERGPELFVPDSTGTIIPNHEMGGANIVVNVDASGSSVQGDGGQAEELGSMLAAAVQAEIANQQRPGGLLAGTR